MPFIDNNGNQAFFRKEDINLNTIVAVVGFLGMFATFIAAWTTIQYKQGEMQKWQETSSAQYTVIVARMDNLQEAINKQDEVAYRVTQSEKSQETLDQRMSRLSENSSNQFTEIRATLSILATQITIANESLKRLETVNAPNQNRR